MPRTSVRAAVESDLLALQRIERAAGEPFRGLGMAAIADDDPPPLDTLRQFVSGGRAWVAADEHDVPVAYLLVEVVDDAAHIEQVSVHPAHARHGLGRRLIAVAGEWAAGRGLSALTLTTFADVPWNAPYYSRLGFSVVPDAETGPGLLAVRRHEHELGLDAWPRVSMRRPLQP